MWCFLNSSGRLYPNLGSKVLKALSPYEVLDLEMTRTLYCPSDLGDLVGVYSVIISLRYLTALESRRTLHTYVMALNTVRWFTRNQWNVFNTGVMWSLFFDLVRRRTSCSVLTAAVPQMTLKCQQGVRCCSPIMNYFCH